MQGVWGHSNPVHAHPMSVGGDVDAHRRRLMHPHVANRLRYVSKEPIQVGVVTAPGLTVTLGQVVHRVTFPQEEFQERQVVAILIFCKLDQREVMCFEDLSQVAVRQPCFE